MTLFSICQKVVDSVGLPRPLSIAASTDQLGRQMFALANEILEDLSKMTWPVLELNHTFDTVVDTYQYDMPADWDHQLGDTAYLQSLYVPMRGQLSPGEWQYFRNSSPQVAVIGRYKYRIFGNPLKINITPTPSTVETISIEYIGTSRATTEDGLSVPLYASDTDTSIVPEELVRKGVKWKLKHAKGLDYGEDFNDYEASKELLLAQALAFGALPVAYRAGGDTGLTSGYVPETGYGS